MGRIRGISVRLVYDAHGKSRPSFAAAASASAPAAVEQVDSDEANDEALLRHVPKRERAKILEKWKQAEEQKRFFFF